MADSFAHLHVHTEYSMLDGASRLDEAIAAAVADGQPAMAITDHGNMYGVLDFYRGCKDQGIKPIIGTEIYLAHESRHERPSRRGRADDSGGDTGGGKKLYYHAILMAENNVGYQNSIQLSSKAYMEGYHYKPRADWELMEQYAEGIIATSGCLGGHVLQSLMQGQHDAALEHAARFQDIFERDNFFIELQDQGIPEQRTTNPQLLEIARKINAPILATNDSHYTHQHDAEAHDALLCVQTGSLLSDTDRFKFHGDGHYIKTAGEMRRLFGEVPEACDNTLWIAERCDVEIEFGKPQLPEFPLPEGSRPTRSTSVTSPTKAPTNVGAPTSAMRSSSVSTTSSASSTTWGSRRTSSSPGISSGTPATTTSSRARPRLRRRLCGGLHALDHRSRPDRVRPPLRALSQPSRGRCPTSTWTSTLDTATT